MNKKIPRPQFTDNRVDPAPNPSGFGKRSIWPLPPVGEAARRDPHIPDPVANAGNPIDQRDISPRVREHRWQGKPISAGDGIIYNGLYAAVVYVKRLGNHMTRSLARNYVQGIVESRWRVGGVSLPYDYGFGMGFHGDAASVWADNPQIYLRNPGIKPLTNVPQTYRYAPNMNNFIQDVGPSIGDFGNPPAPGSP